MKRRVVLLGSRATLACIGFRILRELGVEIPLVISGAEDPGTDDWRLSLAKAARESGYIDGRDLFVIHNPHTDEILNRIRAAAPDVVLSLQWRRIIRPSLIQLARCGVVNLHNAPLPLLRGCDPFSWAIHDGLEMMGITFHQVIDTGVDSGPMLTQRLWPTSPSSTAWSLYLDGLREGELLMRETLASIIAGDVAPHHQEPQYTSYHPMGQFRFNELEANWKLPAQTVSAALRSRIFPPFQLPFFYAHGNKIEILECQISSERGAAGAVISIDPFVVGANPGSICILRVRMDGAELPGPEFAASTLKAGQVLSLDRIQPFTQ